MQFAAFLMVVFMLEAVIGVVAYLYEAAVRLFATADPESSAVFNFPLV